MAAAAAAAEYSALVSAVSGLQHNSYLSIALIAAVGYDYILVLPKEIEYIWSKKWTWVSTLYIFVRYCGLYNSIYAALFGSIFVPVAEVFGLPSLSHFEVFLTLIYFDAVVSPFSGLTPTLELTAFEGRILGEIESWTYLLFLGAADFIMILRVWAMYNRSRTVLVVLVAVFAIEIISMSIDAAIYSDPTYEQYLTVPVLQYSVCSEQRQSKFIVFETISTVLQMSFAVVLCLCALFRFFTQSVQMYYATKQWQLTRYVNFLVRQGVIYFFTIFLMTLMNLLWEMNKIPTSGWQVIIVGIVENIPVYTLTPRFIISIREMYADAATQSIHGGRSSDEMDSGFGLSTLRARAGAARAPTVSYETQRTLVDSIDADYRQGEGIGDIEFTPRRTRAEWV